MKKLSLAVFAMLAMPAVANEASWVADARQIATTMPPKMLQVLKDETAKGGSANATVVCREKAPLMAKSISEQSGWNIRRVSLRVRNPKATPDAWNVPCSKTSTGVPQQAKTPPPSKKANWWWMVTKNFYAT